MTEPVGYMAAKFQHQSISQEKFAFGEASFCLLLYDFR